MRPRANSSHASILKRSLPRDVHFDATFNGLLNHLTNMSIGCTPNAKSRDFLTSSHCQSFCVGLFDTKRIFAARMSAADAKSVLSACNGLLNEKL